MIHQAKIETERLLGLFSLDIDRCLFSRSSLIRVSLEWVYDP